MDWNGQHALDVEFATTALMHNGECNPMFVIFGDRGCKIVEGGWPDAAGKVVFFRVMGLMAAAENAVAITFMSEGWVREVRKAHNETQAEHAARCAAIAPSQAEDRQEVLNVQMVYREDDERHLLSTMLFIERDVAGKVVGTRRNEIEGEDGATHHSTLEYILPLKRLTPEQCALAKDLLDTVASAAGMHIAEQPLGKPS
jgi:hypothetical protein